MAWENVIVGYRLCDFEDDEIIPIGAIYVKHNKIARRWCPHSGEVFQWATIYTFQVPVYKKKNIKKDK